LIFTEASSYTPAKIAYLQSIEIISPINIEFYYHMYGEHIGTLSLATIQGLPRI